MTMPSVNDDSVRNTNIEVCVRIRPLVISSDATKFFEGKSSPTRIRPPSRLSRLGRPSQQASQPPTPPALDDIRPAWDVVDSDTVQQSASTTHVQGRTHSYTLDRVYCPSSTTAEMYSNSLRPIVQSAMDGYHASIFAYGQTSTGKTFTMSGTKESPGIVPLAVEDCFSLIETLDARREYLLRISYLEIYNEQIIDLLSSNPQPIRIFESKDGNVIVRGLREEVVSSPAQVFSLISEGEGRRQVGSTNMNKHSSRSHTIFRVWVESRSSAYEHSNVRISSLSLVDLAGSESIRLSGSTGERRTEGQYINKSLMTLGQVVYKLSEMKRPDAAFDKFHIPYRDSKLTRLLQPSLSGNAQIVIICNISPLASHMEESHNTLKFATRAKRIQQKASRTEVTDEKTLLQSYREEIEDLKGQLRQARNAQMVLQPNNGDDDTKELIEAIQKMERLILKAHTPSRSLELVEDLVAASSEDMMLSFDDNEQQPKTPVRNNDFVDELHRIQGLLSTVLCKRSIFSTPGRPQQERDKEVEDLRAQLHEKEVTTSLRKADSSFLQSQLAEKDMLLAEVSKILEAVEKRQVELETENATLKERLVASEENLVLTQRSQKVLQQRLDQLQEKWIDQRTTTAQFVMNGNHSNR